MMSPLIEPTSEETLLCIISFWIELLEKKVYLLQQRLVYMGWILTAVIIILGITWIKVIRKK